jgi:hypothetical protein
VEVLCSYTACRSGLNSQLICGAQTSFQHNLVENNEENWDLEKICERKKYHSSLYLAISYEDISSDILKFSDDTKKFGEVGSVWISWKKIWEFCVNGRVHEKWSFTPKIARLCILGQIIHKTWITWYWRERATKVGYMSITQSLF